MKIKKAIDTLFKKDEILPFEEGESLLNVMGVNLGKLNLENSHNCYFNQYFENLEIKPYMDLNEMKLKVTGNYVYSPIKISHDHRPKEKRIKIDTFVRIQN